MKKIIAISLLLVVILISLNGCTYEYSGDHIDLYTVALNSVLWNNGYSYGADREKDPDIEIIDKDMYGRTMFTYHEKYYKGTDMAFSALIVCQYSNEKDVYYYEDINYVVKEQTLYDPNIKEFEDDEIEQLKLANDWNQEINFNKCVKKEIAKSKPDIPYENGVENKIINEFYLIDMNYNLFMDFLTSNSDNSRFIIYGYIRFNEIEGIYFVGIAESEKDSLKSLNFLVPLNIFDYKTEFIEFKKINGWEIKEN